MLNKWRRSDKGIPGEINSRLRNVPVLSHSATSILIKACHNASKAINGRGESYEIINSFSHMIAILKAIGVSVKEEHSNGRLTESELSLWTSIQPRIIRKINQMDASKNNNRQFKIHKTSALNILNDLNKAIIANEVTSRGRLASTGAVVNRFRTSRIH